MAELRKFNNSGSVTIPWKTTQDERLSFTARGVLSYVLSLPDGWQCSIERIAAHCKAKVKGSGREAVTSAMRELEDAGYRRVVDERDAGGRVRRWAEFAFAPVPEWAEVAAAERYKRSHKTGGKCAPVADDHTSDDRTSGTRSMVRPGETPGGTGPQEPAPRQARAVRESTREGDTHNAREDVVDSSAPPADGVCEEPPSFKDDGARAVIGWEVTPEQVRVGDLILTATVHPDVAHLISAEDRERLAARAGALLARGWSRQLVERTLNRRTNAATLAPTVIVERALNEAIQQSLTPSPHRLGVEQAGSKMPKRATLDKALAAADRLYPDEREFTKITKWLKTASAHDVDKWLADRKAEAEAAPLHIPMTNAPAQA
jgi:hypothetical protein